MANIKKQFLFFTCALATLLLSACSARGADPSATKPAPTFTPVVTPTLTLADTPALASLTDMPAPPEAQTSGPFEAVSDANGISLGKVYDLWVSPDGMVWVAGSSSVFRYADGSFQAVYDKPLSRILGRDDAGRVWGLGAGGEKIAAYNGTSWEVYGPDQGWDTPTSASFGDGVATDPQGNVWLATGSDDLRRFDPQAGRWMSLTATEIGFKAADPDYQGHYLASVARSQSGAIWVADCIGKGEGFDGQGVRWLKDGKWNPILATEGNCVFDIEQDKAGRMWVGAPNALLRYDSANGAWTKIPLPTWERPQIVTSIDLDPAGDPWVSMYRCGGASCSDIVAYFLKNDAWIPLQAEGVMYMLPPNIAFSADGTAWVCSEGSIYQRTLEQAELIGTLNASACVIAVDGAGTVWVGNAAGLWKLEP